MEPVYEELRGRMRKKKRKQAAQVEALQRQLQEMRDKQAQQPVMPFDQPTQLGVGKPDMMGNNIYRPSVNLSNGAPMPSPLNIQPYAFQNNINPALLDAQRQMAWRQQQAILEMSQGLDNTPGSMMADIGTDSQFPPVLLDDLPSDMYDRFFSNFSGCQPGEKPKDCRKRIKVEGREEARITKAEAKRLKAEAKTILAEQGINGGGGGGNKAGKILKGIGDAAGGILGGIFGNKSGGDAGSDGGAYAPDPNAANAGGGSKTTTYIIIGVVVVLVIGVVFFMMKKK